MIEHFSCVNLRCFEKIEVPFKQDFTLIEGKNGSGKTTILEGIYLSIRGKSFLTGKLPNLVKDGSDFFKIRTEIDGNSIQINYFKKNRKKDVFFNGKRTVSSYIFLKFPLFIFNGRLLNFIRTDLLTLYKFFNIILSLYDKSYLKAYKDYLNALKQKRTLLTSDVKNDTIISWNLILEERSNILRNKREDFVKKINDLLNKETFILYKKNAYSEKNDEIYERELKEKKILTGCHKDRFFILKNNKDMRFFYSSGQQKNIFFGILKAVGKIFSEKTGRKPILLLDDFDSEFDMENLTLCLKSVLPDFQVILTTTERKKYSCFDYNLISL